MKLMNFNIRSVRYFGLLYDSSSYNFKYLSKITDRSFSDFFNKSNGRRSEFYRYCSICKPVSFSKILYENGYDSYYNKISYLTFNEIETSFSEEIYE